MLASLLTWCISQKTLSMWEKDCEQIFFFKLSDYRIFTMNIINKEVVLPPWTNWQDINFDFLSPAACVISQV